MLSRYKEAVDDCDAALKADSTLVKLHIRKGRCLIKMGHCNAADEAFSRVLEYHLRDLLGGADGQGLMDLDEQERAALALSLDGFKAEAKAALRDIDKLRVAVRSLVVLEGQQNYQDALKTADNILTVSPYFRVAQIARASALCELLRFEEAKQFMEDVTCKTHSSMQTFYAHSSFVFPCPLLSTLIWIECKEGASVLVDARSVASAMMCMGAEMAAVYLIALKNLDAVRSYCADVMSKVSALLADLSSRLSEDDKRDAWAWVVEESKRVTSIITLKNTADKQFKNRDFRGALYSYGCALKVPQRAKSFKVHIKNVLMQRDFFHTGGSEREAMVCDPVQQPRGVLPGARPVRGGRGRLPLVAGQGPRLLAGIPTPRQGVQGQCRSPTCTSQPLSFLWLSCLADVFSRSTSTTRVCATTGGICAATPHRQTDETCRSSWTRILT